MAVLEQSNNRPVQLQNSLAQTQATIAIPSLSPSSTTQDTGGNSNQIFLFSSQSFGPSPYQISVPNILSTLNNIQTSATTGMPSAPSEAESGYVEKFKDAVIDNLASYTIGAVIGAIGMAYLYARKQLQKGQIAYHDLIAVETIEFRRVGNSEPYIAFRKSAAVELDDILDPEGLELFNRGLKRSKKDSLSFLLFESNPNSIAHHVIGNPMAEFAEAQLAGTLINLKAAASRMGEGIASAQSSRQVTRFFGFFTCDKIGSVEQPRQVLVQKEDIINVILDLRAWWEATERESQIEAADSKTNLGRILEFAVSLAIRHPKALLDSFNDKFEKTKVHEAIARAEALKKILVVAPDDTTAWLDKFITSDAFDLEANSLPEEFAQSEKDWVEVLKDWYLSDDLDKCRASLAKERELTSFRSLLDLSVEHQIPMWSMLVDIPTSTK